MEDRDKLITRIKNLLDMANDASSPHEAAIAAKRARALMDKHQIDAHEIGAKADDFDAIPQGKAYKFMPYWKNILAVAVGKYNDCQTTTTHEYYANQKSYRKRIKFSGFRSDVIVAGAMYDYLCNTIDRLCAAYIMTEHPLETKYPAKIGDSYKKGAALTLCERIRLLIEERTKDLKTSTGTSLVVIKSVQVEAKFGAVEYGKKQLKVRDDHDVRDAMYRGKIDGHKISLNSQLQEENRPKVTS